MASRHAHLCGSLGYGPEGSPHGSVIASSRLLPRTHVFMTHCHVTQGYQMSTSTLMHPTLVPGRDLPHLMLAMPHPYLFHASEAVRCTHSLGPASYLLPTSHTHTPHFRHYYTFWCGRRWPQDMHTYADLSDMDQKDLPTAVRLHLLDYSRGHTCS